MVPISILDLVNVPEGGTPASALRASGDLVQHAERLGFQRYWVAEHHNMDGIASAATSVVIAYLAAATHHIRIGAGGIMLPNHSPLQVAEQFGTLESLYPGRIDLGLGRAPGTDQATARAMRRDPRAGDQFPDDVLELQRYFDEVEPDQPVRAVPGAGLHVPLWILGSSLFGAQLAAHLGLPYAFASHFAPEALASALAIYRQSFRSSRQLDGPWAMPCINVIVADTDAEAVVLFTSLQQAFTRMLRGQRGLFPQPIEDIESFWSPVEKVQAQQMLSCSFVGCPTTVRAKLDEFSKHTAADELMVSTAIVDHSARVHSLELLAQLAAEV